MLTDSQTIYTCIDRNHDVARRHEDGSLLSATCHDCGHSWRRPTLRTAAQRAATASYFAVCAEHGGHPWDSERGAYEDGYTEGVRVATEAYQLERLSHGHIVDDISASRYLDGL